MLRLMLLKVCCLLALFTAEVVAQENPDRAVIEIIEVTNRNPVTIKAEIAQALDPRGSIGVVDNKLIVASTASNFSQLRDLIAQADVPMRRLVVSVDFDHSNPTIATAQQSQQAIEGDVVRFESPSAEDAADMSSQPQILVHSSIRNNLAVTEIEVLNVPGFSGRHQLQFDLGRWYVLNPPVEEVDEFAFDPSLDGAQDLPLEPVTEAPVPQNPAAPQNLAAPIAVRVDVLP
jgi:hypothetical protein